MSIQFKINKKIKVQKYSKGIKLICECEHNNTLIEVFLYNYEVDKLAKIKELD